MNLTSDQRIFWQHGFITLNETIVTTWALMLVMTVGAMLLTRRLTTDGPVSRSQALLEMIVVAIEKQIQEVGLSQPKKYLPFLGTLFLFVAMAALCTVIPGYEPPTGSLSNSSEAAMIRNPSMSASSRTA